MLRVKTTTRALTVVLAMTLAAVASAQDMPTTATRPDHQRSAEVHEQPPETLPDDPALPEGMSLDDVLDRAALEAPEDWPLAIHDTKLRTFVLFEQLEYRVREEGTNHLGWETQGWVGYDYDKFWWKFEGEAAFDGVDEGESELDLLYARLITPFWNVQVGVQYANEWESSAYDDRWSAALAFQGLAPGMFEMDVSMYLSEHGDFTADVEVEYDLRITQRLVLQPRAELSFAAQDVPERMLGAGMTGAKLDLRLRYEFEREFAPYVGVRYSFLTGETANIVESAGGDREELFFLAGVRLTF